MWEKDTRAMACMCKSGQFQCFHHPEPCNQIQVIRLDCKHPTPTGPKSFFRGLEMEQEGKNVPLPPLEILKTVS